MSRFGAIASTTRITVEKKAGEKFDRIVGYALDSKPPRLESEDGLPDYAAPDPVGTTLGIPNEEIPF